MSDNEKRLRKIQQLRSTNAGLMGEIEQYGGSVDLGIARIEHLVRELVTLGVLTEEQQLDEAEKWERSLRSQLIPVRDRMLEAFNARKQELARRQKLAEKKPAEVSPPAAGLIIPKR